MKSFATRLGLCMGLLRLAPAATRAAGSYSDSLKAADAALGARQVATALQELEAAVTQAANEGERALALAKKADVLAFSKQDYAAARGPAEEALKVQALAPVAKIIALKALAQCQIKADKNYSGAMANLQAALALPGEDWAKPMAAIMLADCYREIQQLNDAFTTYQSVLTLPAAGAYEKATAHLHMAFIYQYDRKDAAKARESYAAAVQLRPELRQEVDGHLGRLSGL